MVTPAATPSEYRPELGAAFDLSGRTKLRVTGADRLRYLNGQITNDLRKATETATIHACVLSAKGKVDADVFIAADGDAYVLDADEGVRESLAARLDRYIIADDVKVEDVTDQFALFHVLGAAAPTLSTAAKFRGATRLGESGIDLWVERAEHERTWQELARALPRLDDEAVEALRIERGIPRWGRELTGEIIPTEANLEATTIDYAKGCYIGQEVISRIKMSGQTNKRLCGFAVVSGRIDPGMRLFSIDETQKDVGWLTSAVSSARLGGQIALGFVKRGFQEPGSRYRAETAGNATTALVEIAALPFN